jgi:glycosyltransferase involved in cell wall biosynthesis
MFSPEVSIVIPTRDRQDQLARCLQSLFKLNSSNFEILVVDNGSKKFSVPSLNYVCHTRFFQQPVQGVCYARNLGIRNAFGKVVAFIDDDAEADPDWLRLALKNFEDPQVTCVTGKVVPSKVATEWQGMIVSVGWHPSSETPLRLDRKNYDPVGVSPGIACNLMIRKSFFVDGGFSEVFGPGSPVGGSEEDDLFFRIVKGGGTIVYDPRVIVYHEFVANEHEYTQKIVQYSKARAAYLIKLLLTQKRRLSVVKYIMRKLFRSSDKKTGRPSFGLRSKGFLVGPIALLQSALLARRNRDAALRRGVLLAEFDNKDDLSA